MMSLRSWIRTACALATGVLFAACAQHAGTLPPSTAFAPQRIAIPDRNPPKCKGQKDSKKYSSVTATLSTKGGSFCIPEFGGFGGKVKYPGANPSVKLTVTTSTTNYDQMPQLGQGNPIVYLQLGISGKTSFAYKAGVGGGLTSKSITPGQPYTAYGQAKIYGFPVNFGPCYAVATKGKYGGVLGGIGTLLQGASVPAAATAVVEVYSGNQGGGEC